MNIEKIKRKFKDKLSNLNNVINTIDYKDADTIYKKIRTVSMDSIKSSTNKDSHTFLELKKGADKGGYFSINGRDKEYCLIDFINQYKDKNDFSPKVYDTRFPKIEFTTWLRQDEISERVNVLTKLTIRREIEDKLGYNINLNCKVMDLYKQKKINWEDVVELHKNCDV